MYKIKYYAVDNKSPVVEFIKNQSPKHRAKILREIDLLEEFGLFLGMPHIKKLKNYNDLWELRVNLSTQIKKKISMELLTASYRLKINLYY